MIIAVSTITTVGYGDITPDDYTTRGLAVIFVPLAAFATASLLASFAQFSAERKIVKAQTKSINKGLNLSDLELMDKDKSGSVSKLEFFEFMLLSMEKVDIDFINRLHAQFDDLDT